MPLSLLRGMMRAPVRMPVYFMLASSMAFPRCYSNKLYSNSQEWIIADNYQATVGVTSRLCQKLGGVVFADLGYAVDAQVNIDDPIATLEGGNSTRDIYSPVSGVISEVNEDINSNVDLLNSDPEGDGWLYKIKLTDTKQLQELNEEEVESDD